MGLRKSVLMGSVSTFVMLTGAVHGQGAAVDEFEEITVTGIRGGLKQALSVKRNNNAIVDAISAEDIGKFPDKNVAESLQRITGVTIQREFGEGQAVAIRGASSNMTLTTLNGQNVASTGWFVFEPARRSFNYSLLPSELVGDIEVYKSAQADLPEGGIGGTVVIHTRKPLDLDSMSIYGSVEGAHTSDSDKIDPQASILGSWKNEDETVGLLVSGVYQRRQMQRQGNEAWWEWGAGPVGFKQDRKRSALNATLQFKPTENWDIALNWVRMQMRADNTNWGMWLTQGNTSWSGVEVPEADKLRGTPVRGPVSAVYMEARPREATMKSNVYDFDAKYVGEGYEIDFQIGKTTSSGGTDFEMELGDGTGPTALEGASYDFSGGALTWDLNGFDLSNYTPGSLDLQLGPNNSKFNRTPKTDDEFYIQGDLTHDVDWGVVKSIKAGLKYTDHHTTSRKFAFSLPEGFDPKFSLSGLDDGKLNIGLGDFQMINYDISSILEAANAAVTGEVEDLGSYQEIKEKNFAAYAMAEFEGDGFRGNVGLRYVTTDAKSIYFLDGTQGSAEASYSEWLPSFNLAMDLSDDLILRTTAARALTRPQYVDMYVNPSVAGVDDIIQNNQTWTIGNVGLKPFVSNQLDVSLEWYFAEGSILSAAFFMKDVKNFVSTRVYPASADEIPFPLADESERETGWTVAERYNGDTALIKGIELQYQQDFGNGFGGILNYTYTDSHVDDPETYPDQNTVMSDASKHAFNASGYYESDDFQIRVSYNYRSDYMIRAAVGYAERLNKGWGTVDASARWFVTDNISVNLDANNLFTPNTRQFGNHDWVRPNHFTTKGFPAFAYETARRITLGVSFKY